MENHITCLQLRLSVGFMLPDAVVLSDGLESQKPGIPGSSNSWQHQWLHLPTQHNTGVPSTTTVCLHSFSFWLHQKESAFQFRGNSWLVHMDNFSLQLYGLSSTSRDPTVFVLINKMPSTICHLPLPLSGRTVENSSNWKSLSCLCTSTLSFHVTSKICPQALKC